MPMARLPATRRNRQFALAATVYLAFLYGSLAFTPAFANWLLSRLGWTGYSLAINAIIVGVAALIVVLVRRAIFPLDVWRVLGLAFIVAGYWLIVQWAESPASRFHALQYGLLALLVTESLRGQLPLPRVYLWVLLIVMAAGMGDEAIQLLLPNRNATMKEVLQNWTSTALAQGAILVLKDSRARSHEPLTDAG
jgi:hypothetical protein